MSLDNNLALQTQDTNYRELSLQFPILRDDFVYPTKKTSHATFRLDATNSLHPDALKFFESINLKVKAMIFNTPPHGRCSIHVDGYTMHQQWGINWVWGSEDHSMSWWMPKDKKIDFNKAKQTNAGTPYMFWDEEETNFLQSVKITRPTLLKTGVPHKVENFTDQDRWALSVRPINPSSWTHALNIFNDYLL